MITISKKDNCSGYLTCASVEGVFVGLTFGNLITFNAEKMKNYTNGDIMTLFKFEPVLFLLLSSCQ